MNRANIPRYLNSVIRWATEVSELICVGTGKNNKKKLDFPLQSRLRGSLLSIHSCISPPYNHVTDFNIQIQLLY